MIHELKNCNCAVGWCAESKPRSPSRTFHQSRDHSQLDAVHWTSFL